MEKKKEPRGEWLAGDIVENDKPAMHNYYITKKPRLSRGKEIKNER